MFGRVTTEDDEGLGGLLVTDGHQITHTRADGSFELTTPEGELIMVAAPGVCPPAHLLVEDANDELVVVLPGQQALPGILMELHLATALPGRSQERLARRLSA
ncbi:hypothetical protein [Arsenicicoccus dermatophilus]|uniref:hypothetical protein n=1 Tax=Arsenicicoccus dermatophilus TaxID=1076331 RepID=UPI003916EE49